MVQVSCKVRSYALIIIYFFIRYVLNSLKSRDEEGQVIEKKIEAAVADNTEASEETAKVEDSPSTVVAVKYSTAKWSRAHLFNGLRIYISREVPRDVVDFILLSGGADEVLSADDETNSTSDLPASMASLPLFAAELYRRCAAVDADPSLPKINLVVVDRPSKSPMMKSERDLILNFFLLIGFLQFCASRGIEAVQPQWVLDSFNNNTILPVAEYVPENDGKLPPHLSPFAESGDGIYVPERKTVLDAIRRKKVKESSFNFSALGSYGNCWC
jgi:hypothetical protein